VAKTVFSIFADQDSPVPIVARDSVLTLFEPDADEGQERVESAVECYFDDDDEAWARLFGDDEVSATVIVEVHEPAPIAGRYDVDLRRTVKASAMRLDAAKLATAEEPAP
jgi:hypothetical protein